MPSYLQKIIYVAVAMILSANARAEVDQAFNKKAVVFTTTVQKTEFSDSVQYPARVRSRVNAWMSAENPGLVQQILKPAGSKVHRGDVVLILKNIDPVFKYAPVKILSPADGYVTNLDVDLLTRAEKGDKLFSITDPANLIVEAEIPASDLHYFKIGDHGVLRCPSGKDSDVKIFALSPAVDLKTGTANALLSFINKSEAPLANLNQGQLGQLAFRVNTRKSVVIPESALVLRSGGTFVRILNGKKAKLVPVTVSLDLGDKVEIQKGLSDGEQVITRWSRFIGDDEEVDVQAPEKGNL